MALSCRPNSLLLLYLVSSLTAPTFATPNYHPSTLTSRARVLNPSSPPNPVITQPAKIEHALFARGIATCGYISGNGAYPLTCPAGYTCTSTFQDLAGWACCNQIECVGNYRTCANYGAALCADNLDVSVCSNIYTSILSCSDSAAPSCFVYARSTHIGDFDTAYSYGCGASGGTVLALATTTDAGGAAAAASSTSTDYFLTAPTTYDTNTDLFSTSAPTATSDGSSPNSSSSNSSSDSGLNTGSIIGIIIGAVSAVGTLVGAYYAWKAVQKRRDRGPARGPGQDGGGVYTTVRPAYTPAPEVYNVPPRVMGYGPQPPPYGGGRMYQNGWR